MSLSYSRRRPTTRLRQMKRGARAGGGAGLLMLLLAPLYMVAWLFGDR